MNSSTKKSFYPWLVISFSALFLFYKYVLQVSPSVMTTQLMRHFHLDGMGLGNLAAMYFYTYLVMQLFAGLILDRWSPRKITAIAIAVAAMGSIFFAIADSLYTAWIARACIGLGVAFATVSYMKMATLYFKPERFAFVGGLLASAAMFGSMGGQAPLAYLIEKVDWQNSLIYCGIGGLVLAALFFLIVRDKANPHQTSSGSITWKDIVLVLKKRGNWLMMLYSGLAFVPLSLFGGLWGNPFLETAYNLTTTQAASLSTVMFVGLAFGSPFFGYLSDAWSNRIGIMIAGLWVSLIAILIVLYFPHLSYFFLALFLFIFGLGSGAFMLAFAVGRDINNAALMATVVSLLNTGEPILGAFSDPLVGKILDIFWHGKIVNGVHVFGATDYRLALAILPIYLLLALVCLLCLQFKPEDKYKLMPIPQ